MCYAYPHHNGVGDKSSTDGARGRDSKSYPGLVPLEKRKTYAPRSGYRQCERKWDADRVQGGGLCGLSYSGSKVVEVEGKCTACVLPPTSATKGGARLSERPGLGGDSETWSWERRATGSVVHGKGKPIDEGISSVSVVGRFNSAGVL